MNLWEKRRFLLGKGPGLCIKRGCRVKARTWRTEREPTPCSDGRVRFALWRTWGMVLYQQTGEQYIAYFIFIWNIKNMEKNGYIFNILLILY